jgi:hypothetical protein
MRKTPKPSVDHARGSALPAARPADYSDELTKAQIEALRACAPQDEAKMGPMVHEFSW